MKTLIKNIKIFDGSEASSYIADVLIENDRIADIGENLNLPVNIIDGSGKWLMPGFIDTHTHYDAEIMLSPGLKESVRHGVTTVLFGSCSISMVYSSPEDCSDIFTRVEGVPRAGFNCLPIPLGPI